MQEMPTIPTRDLKLALGAGAIIYKNTPEGALKKTQEPTMPLNEQEIKELFAYVMQLAFEQSKSDADPTLTNPVLELIKRFAGEGSNLKSIIEEIETSASSHAGEEAKDVKQLLAESIDSALDEFTELMQSRENMLMPDMVSLVSSFRDTKDEETDKTHESKSTQKQSRSGPEASNSSSELAEKAQKLVEMFQKRQEAKKARSKDPLCKDADGITRGGGNHTSWKSKVNGGVSGP